MNQLMQVKYNSKKASILRDVKKEKRTETVVEKFQFWFVVQMGLPRISFHDALLHDKRPPQCRCQLGKENASYCLQHFPVIWKSWINVISSHWELFKFSYKAVSWIWYMFISKIFGKCPWSIRWLRTETTDSITQMSEYHTLLSLAFRRLIFQFVNYLHYKRKKKRRRNTALGFKGKLLELLKWAWVLPISKWHVSVNVSESYLLQELCKCTLWWSFRVLEQWNTFSPVFYKKK